MTINEKLKLPYRADIDGLRAIAVILVLIGHSHYEIAGISLLPAGFLGVDVFFALSGYLITRILYAEHSVSEFRFLEFLKRRIRRLAPALLLVLLFCAVVGHFFLFLNENLLLHHHILASVFFIQNINLLYEIGYFDTQAISKPLLHIWSLSVEEQFYLIYPALFLAVWKIQARINLLAVLLIAMFLSLCTAIWMSIHFPGNNFYLPQTRAWELLAGASLAVFQFKQVKPKLQRYSGMFSIAGLMLILLPAMYYTPATPHPGLPTLLPILGTLFLLYFGNAKGLVNAALSSKPAVFLGKISYGLYLWHWPLFSFAYIFWGEHSSPTLTAALTGIAILLSYLSYRLIESPIRQQRSIIKPPQLLIASTVLILASACIITIKGATPSSFAQKTQGHGAQLDGPVWHLSKNDICQARHPTQDSDTWNWWFCIQNNDKNTDVLLLGTSYANQYYPAFLEATTFKDKTILSYGTCSVTEFYYPKKYDHPGHPCLESRSSLQAKQIDSIIKNETPELIVIAAEHNFHKTYAELMLKRMHEFNKLAEENSKFMVILPHLMPNDLKFDTRLCLARPLSSPPKNCTVSTDRMLKWNQKYDILKETLKADFPSVTFVNPNDIYCNALGCRFILDGLPIFRDPANHFSRHYNSYFSKVLEDMFSNNPS